MKKTEKSNRTERKLNFSAKITLENEFSWLYFQVQKRQARTACKAGQSGISNQIARHNLKPSNVLMKTNGTPKPT